MASQQVSLSSRDTSLRKLTEKSSESRGKENLPRYSSAAMRRSDHAGYSEKAKGPSMAAKRDVARNAKGK